MSTASEAARLVISARAFSTPAPAMRRSAPCSSISKFGPRSSVLKTRMRARPSASVIGTPRLSEPRENASPALLRRLNPELDRATAGTVLKVPAVAGPATARAARVVVDRSESVLRLLDDGGRVLAQYPASTGSEHDPLPIGDWSIVTVVENPTFHYNPELFWDADPKHEKATLAPGPNNPVGSVWIDLSKPHYGIHGTPEPASVGKAQSHGCIRLTNWDAKAVAAAVDANVPVTLQE